MKETTLVMSVLDLLQSGIVSTQSSADLAENFKESGLQKDDRGAMEVASKLQEDLFRARITMIDARTELVSLLQEIEKRDFFERTLAKYKTATLPDGGAIYVLREPDETGSLFLLVCPCCVIGRKEFFPLQGGSGEDALVCPNCKSTYDRASGKD